MLCTIPITCLLSLCIYMSFFKVFRSPKISRVSEQRAAVLNACDLPIVRSLSSLPLSLSLFHSIFVSFFRHNIFRFSFQLVCVRLFPDDCVRRQHTQSKSICNNKSSDLGYPYKTNWMHFRLFHPTCNHLLEKVCTWSGINNSHVQAQLGLRGNHV